MLGTYLKFYYVLCTTYKYWKKPEIWIKSWKNKWLIWYIPRSPRRPHFFQILLSSQNIFIYFIFLRLSDLSEERNWHKNEWECQLQPKAEQFTILQLMNDKIDHNLLNGYFCMTLYPFQFPQLLTKADTLIILCQFLLPLKSERQLKH